MNGHLFLVTPDISITLNTQSVVEDDTIELTCTVMGSYPIPRVEWFKGDDLVDADRDDRINIGGEPELMMDTMLYNLASNLSISDAVTSDSGMYICQTLSFPMDDPILPSVMASVHAAVDVTSKSLIIGTYTHKL